MNANDPMQQNIRRTTGQHALKKILAIVEEEKKNDAATAGTLRWLLRYGWVVLLIIAAFLARLIGVF